MDNAIDDAFPSSNALSTVTTKESNIPALREASEATPTTYVLDGVQITKKQYNNLDVARRKTVKVNQGKKAKSVEVAKNPMFKVQGIPTSKGEESYLTTQLEAFGIDPLSPRAIDITKSQTEAISDVYQEIDFDLGETLKIIKIKLLTILEKQKCHLVIPFTKDFQERNTLRVIQICYLQLEKNY